jgi:hypothetical protein
MSEISKADSANRGESIDPSVTSPGNVAPTETVGAPGFAAYGGYVVTGELDSKLQGEQKYLTYSDIIANTAIVAAGVRYYLQLISKARWVADPVDDTPAAEEMAEKVMEIMEGTATPWHRIVRRAAGFSLYGFSLQEWTAKKEEDGTVSMLDIEPRAQATITRWDTDEAGTVLGVWQTNPQTGKEQYIPREKMIYLVDDSLNDSPEGLGLLRHITRLADRLKRYELLEAWGFETDLRGIPIARGPFSDIQKAVKDQQISQSQANELQAPLLDFVTNHNRNPELGLLLDSRTYRSIDEAATPSSTRQWDVELMTGDPTSAAEAAAAIERMNREIARVFGVEHLLLGGDGGGSESLSRDKSQTFGMLVDSVLKELVETFQSDFLGPLWILNGWDEDLKPKLKVEQIQFRDIETLTGALEQLSRAGFMMDANDPAGNEIRTIIGLSERPEQEEVDPEMDLGGMDDFPAGDEDEVPTDEEQQPTEKAVGRMLRKLFRRDR